MRNSVSRVIAAALLLGLLALGTAPHLHVTDAPATQADCVLCAVPHAAAAGVLQLPALLHAAASAPPELLPAQQLPARRELPPAIRAPPITLSA